MGGDSITHRMAQDMAAPANRQNQKHYGWRRQPGCPGVEAHLGL